ncbi:bacteriocin fulvocin C-related protein [Pedobacter ghigonis]|uniref:bacteriocin fulvocin C-related protein n=1 Tax=Pedobacter ghigonis TaxID=2730403 RepID=UPI0015893B9C|nr:bacteriocin fulvocin C-related protein [Pedobacter ghigonis]
MNIKSYLLISFLVLAFGCKKSHQADDQVATTRTGIQTALVHDILAITNDDNRRLAFSQLSNIQRFDFWKAKLSMTLDKTNYTAAQLELLREMYGYIVPRIFEESDEKEIFHNSVVPMWVRKASKIFSSKEIYEILFSLDYEEQPVMALSTSGSETAGCICAVGSGYTCGKWNGSYPPGFTWGTCTKSSSNDCAEYRDCGALFDLMCNGDICNW